MKSCVVTANYACDPNKVWLYLTLSLIHISLGISQSYISRLEKRIIRRLRRELEAVG